MTINEELYIMFGDESYSEIIMLYIPPKPKELEQKPIDIIIEAELVNPYAVN